MVRFSTTDSSAKRRKIDSAQEGLVLLEEAAREDVDEESTTSSMERHPQPGNERPSDASSFEAIIDMDALECPICMEPLSPPIFQCCNGHYPCCCCTAKMNNKCPICLECTGKIRNLGLERIIESVRFRCRFSIYGCMEKLSLEMMKIHGKRCLFAHTECPMRECGFLGPIKDLSLHFHDSHYLKTTEFQFEAWFTVHLARGEQYMLLRSQDVLLLLHISEERIGNVAYVTSFHECAEEEAYTYCMTVNNGKQRLTMENVVPYCIEFQKELYADYFLVIPTKGPLHIDLLFHQP